MSEYDENHAQESKKNDSVEIKKGLVQETSSEEQLRDVYRKKNRKKKIKKLVIWLVIIVIAIAIMWFYNFYKNNGRFPWAPEKQNNFFGTTEEVQVKESVYSMQIDLSGYVVPADSQTVRFRSTGAVTGVFVDEGDAVKKGDLLVTIDDTSQQSSLAKIEMDIERAKLTGSASELKLLEMQLKTALNNLEYTKAYANFDGVVASVGVSEGDYFEAGSTAMTIIDRSQLKATVEIDEIDMQYVHKDMKATLYFDSVPGVAVEAYVSYIPMIGRYTNQGIGVMDVEITIPNPPAGVAPGYTFSGIMDVQSEQVMLLVPQSAVTTSRNGSSTVTKKLEDGSSQVVPVVVKYLGENTYQIVSGDIQAGDILLMNLSGTISNMMGGMASGMAGSTVVMSTEVAMF